MMRRSFILVLTLSLFFSSGLGALAHPRLISAPDGGSCTTFVAYVGDVAGFDVNGNGECTDTEVRLLPGMLPVALQTALRPSEHVALCAVIDRNGSMAPFLGYGPSGEYRGKYDSLTQLPLDGSILPGGLNGDGDCSDREYRSAFSPVESVEYIALGDSIASGHGLMDQGGECRRSDLAYPRQVAAVLNDRYRTVIFDERRHLACSGSRAVGAEGAKSLNWQVDRALERLSNRPTLVTISIGANDFHWSDPGNFIQQLYLQTDEGYRDWADRKADEVEAALYEELKRLTAHSNVYVVVTEYYNPFNSDSVFFLSPLGDGCVFRDCHERTEYGIEALNGALRDAVSRIGNPLRVTMTSGIQDAFVGHEAPSKSCGNNDPGTAETWVQYRDDPNSNSQPGIAVWFGDRVGDWNGDCFHPNAKGATQIAGYVDRAAKSMGF